MTRSRIRDRCVRRVRGLFLVTAFVLAFSTVVGADDWSQWRGPGRTGVSKEKGWLVTWPPKEVWRGSVGEGYSSVAVVEGRLYTLGWKDGKDHVYCLDAETGKEIWVESYECGKVDFPGPRATPLVVGKKVYTFSQEGHLNCYDSVKGRKLWNIKVDAGKPGWGFCGSPLLYKNLIILNAGGAGAAVSTSSRKVVWKNDGKAAHSSPVPMMGKPRSSVLLFVKDGLVNVDPRNGEKLWSFPWKTSYDINAADPVVYKDKIFVSSGYGVGCALIGIKDGKPEVVWQNKEMKNRANTSILLGDYVYGISDSGELKCLDLNDGSVKWAQGGFGEGSLSAADGKLIVLSFGGDLSIVKADPARYDTEGRSSVNMGGQGETRTIPVLANGKIYCRRADGTLVCYEVKGGS